MTAIDNTFMTDDMTDHYRYVVVNNRNKDDKGVNVNRDQPDDLNDDDEEEEEEGDEDEENKEEKFENSSLFKNSTWRLGIPGTLSAKPKYSTLDRLETGQNRKPSPLPLNFLKSFQKAKSSDFVLDRIISKRPASMFKMTRIEKGLYIGDNDAATDVILLESNSITHIITVDTVPLPRRITSLLPKLALLHLHITDLPEEDILCHFDAALDFISKNSSGENNVLVHCYRGKSRSATLVIAFLMKMYSYSLETALNTVKAKRDIINPNPSFMAQLKLFENMKWTLDSDNVQYRMFKLRMAAERMRKAKVLFRDVLERILDPDLYTDPPKTTPPIVYKCKRCGRILASSLNLLPHMVDQSPDWTDSIWSSTAENVLDSFISSLCSQSVFINPVKWMQRDIKSKLSGKLTCPDCGAFVGDFSWIRGEACYGCNAHVSPSFRLNVTKIIFRTKSAYLSRKPIMV